MDTWAARVENIREVLRGRRAAMIADAVSLFSLTEEEQDLYFGTPAAE